MDLTQHGGETQPAAGDPSAPRARVVTGLVTAAITLATWPIVRLTPEHGIDGSWWAGLHMAAHRGMTFGTEVGFTYGPLGFLGVPRLFYPGTIAFAVVYSVAVHAILVALVFTFTRRRAGSLWAGVLALAVATVALVEPAELVPIVYLLGCIACLSLDAPQRRTTIVVLCGTVLTAFQTLVKFNTGIVVFLLAAALACSLPRRRVMTVTAHAAGSVALLVSFWVAVGQPLDALGRWLRISFELASGYSSAMAFEQGFRWPEYPIAFVAVGWLGFLVATRRDRAPRARRALLLMLPIAVFYEWKHSFVRHDLHSAGFFLTLGLVALSIPWLGRRLARTALGTALALIVLVAIVLPHQTKRDLFRPAKSVSQIASLVDGGRRERLLATGRAELRNYYRLDAKTLGLLAGRGVHVDPQIAAIAWIYDLEWHPVPVFQAYSAYTPELDRINADALRSDPAPERIVRPRPSAPDDRNPMFESPRYVLSMLCNYRELSSMIGYEVLGRSTNRCGAARLLSSFPAPPGFIDVPVPPFESVLYMSVTRKISLLERIRTFLFKPAATPFVVLRVDGAASRYRLIEATAGGPLVLCVPRSSGFNAHYWQTTCPRAVRLINLSGAQIAFHAVRIGPAVQP